MNIKKYMNKSLILGLVFSMLAITPALAYNGFSNTARFQFNSNGLKDAKAPKMIELSYSSDEIMPMLYGEFPDIIKEPKGYDFVGWSMDKNCKPNEWNKLFTPGDTIENFTPEKTHKFYAIWERE